MKSYIIEIDDQKIWSYEVERMDTAFSCKLLKPHGDKAYWLEESQDYWNWFREEISYVESTEIDICFAYLETAQEEFRKFYGLMPQFNCYTKAEWKSSELIRYFQNFRCTKNNAEFKENPNRFILENGKVIIVSGIGAFCLVNDVASINKANGYSVTDGSVSGKMESNILPKKSRIKVYYPTERNFDDVPKAQSKPVIKKEEFSTRIVEKDIPLEKITAEDVQRYIERKTEGQCDTVNFRVNSIYTDNK